MGKDRQTTNIQLFGIQISTILQTLKPERIKNSEVVPRVQFIYNTSWKKCVATVFTYELLAYQKSLTSERSEQVRPLWIQRQGIRKNRTKHFPCGIVVT